MDTAAGKVRVGVICYDRLVPEAARALMLASAELFSVGQFHSADT